MQIARWTSNYILIERTNNFKHKLFLFVVVQSIWSILRRKWRCAIVVQGYNCPVNWTDGIRKGSFYDCIVWCTILCCDWVVDGKCHIFYTFSTKRSTKHVLITCWYFSLLQLQGIPTLKPLVALRLQSQLYIRLIDPTMGDITSQALINTGITDIPKYMK